MSQEKSAIQDENGDQSIESVPAFRRKRVVIPLLIATCIVASGGYFWVVNALHFISTNDSMVEADRITVSSKILGRIADLRVEEGDTVHAGDTLVILDDADLKVQEKKIAAAVALQKNNAAVALQSFERAQQEAERASRQLKQGVIPKDQFENSQRALAIADAQTKAAQAQIAAAQAENELVKAQLANTIITAGENGVIAKKWVQRGDVVSAGQAVYTAFDLEKLWISAWVEETKLNSVKIGAPVQVRVDAYPHALYTGKIDKIGVGTAALFSLIPPSNASGNFTKITQRVAIKVHLDKEAKDCPPLMPGLSVVVKVKVH